MQKYFLLIGIIAVMCLSVFVDWAHNQVAYKNIKKDALSKFHHVETIAPQTKMPKAEIAGPKGNLITLPEKGRFMLVNLWSINCSECLATMNSIKNLAPALSNRNKQWKIICASVDKPEDLDKVSKFIGEHNIQKLAGYYDTNGSLRKSIAPQTIPVTAIINDKGHILYKVYGNVSWINPDIIGFLNTLPLAKDE